MWRKNNGLLQYLDYIVVLPRSYLERIDVLVAYISNIVYSTQDYLLTYLPGYLRCTVIFLQIGKFSKGLLRAKSKYFLFQKGDFIASFVDGKKIGKTKNTSNLPTMLAKAKEML